MDTTRKTHVTPKSIRRSNSKNRADSHLAQAARLLEAQATDSISYPESIRLRAVAFALRQVGVRLRNLNAYKQSHQVGDGA
jgi:hypothetical protein